MDKTPLNVWMHFPAVNQDPRGLAETQVALAQKYDSDFVKLIPFGSYGVQDHGVEVKIFNHVNLPLIVDDYDTHQIGDRERIEPLPIAYGSCGKQLQAARYMILLAKRQFPVVRAIFNPLTTARESAGDRVPLDMKESPRLFRQALQVLTETTTSFARANIEAGVDGFFFATQCASFDFLTEGQYREFGKFYDRQMIAAYQNETLFNMTHLRSDDGMFQLIADYPINCVSQHDRWSSPALAEVWKIIDKCLLGGAHETPYYDGNGEKIRESTLVSGPVADIEQHVQETIVAAGDKGLVIGPGCIADQGLSEKNLYAFCRTVYRAAALAG